MKKLELKKTCLLIIFALLSTISISAQVENAGKLNVWTKSTFARQKSDSGELIKVRAGKNNGYDRVVFEFKDKIPSYKIEFAKPPFYYGESDNTVKVSGKSFVRATFNSATTHDLETGKSILTYKKGKLGFPVVQETVFIYDFEGTVEFVVGLKQIKDFRITELQNPARVVVDFKH
ncbi:MAG: hypothetical protein M3209_12005 [Acidobacteriota bacterium]|nr:hypothetical protein [Acidobacteriota bacterium]